jgi:osmotically-inducible protein OsmY
MGRRAILAAAFAAGIALGQGATKDDKVYDDVRIKLAHDRDVGKNAIEVVVKDGAVTLRGKVSKPAEKTRAEHIAKRVKGVKSVTNELVVEPR